MQDALALAAPAAWTCDRQRGVAILNSGIIACHGIAKTADGQGRVKVSLPYEDPVCPTISDLYPTCDWHERETMEMFGIRFEGHPRPVKLLLAEPFDGHPLRKDFPLMSREVKPWPGAAEGEEDEEEA